MAKPAPITFEEAVAEIDTMFEEFMVYFEEDVAVAMVVGLNQKRFNDWLPALIPMDQATP